MEGFENYYPLILNLWKNFSPATLEMDDLLQEAWIVYVRARDKYSPDKNASFGTYYKQSLKNRLIEIIRSENSDKRRANLSTTSYEEYFCVNEELEDYIVTPERPLFSRKELFILWKTFTPREASLFYQLLHKKIDNTQELCKEERQLFYNIKRKMKAFLQEN